MLETFRQRPVAWWCIAMVVAWAVGAAILLFVGDETPGKAAQGAISAAFMALIAGSADFHRRQVVAGIGFFLVFAVGVNLLT